MEKYSVLMSVYSKVSTEELKMSINSMIQQTISPDQFIIVLDGPVGTALKKLIEEYCDAYPEMFTVVQLPENHGLAYALNEGIKVARNDIVARMDSDDFSLPNRCEKQLRIFETRDNLSLLGTNTQHFIDDPYLPIDEYGINPVGLKAIKKVIRRNSAFSHPTVMFRKSDVVKAGYYDPLLKRSQDHDLFSRMIHLGFEVDNLSEALVLFRSDKNMMLRNRNPESCKARIVIQKRLLKRKQCSIIDYLYVKLGVLVAKNVSERTFVKIYSFLKQKK